MVKPINRDAITDDELRLDVEAYYSHRGNRSEAARSRGLRRQAYCDRLQLAEERLGLVLTKVADGQLEARASTKMPVPEPGCVARYLLTSAQNNTLVHPSFQNLLALVDFYDGLPNSSCRLLVGTYSYQMAAYGAKAVKRGTFDRSRATEDLWYAQELVPYIPWTRASRLRPGWSGAAR